MKRNILRIIALGLLVLATGILQAQTNGGTPPPTIPPQLPGSTLNFSSCTIVYPAR
jgi:hypothetical protein